MVFVVIFGRISIVRFRAGDVLVVFHFTETISLNFYTLCLENVWILYLFGINDEMELES